MVRENNSKQMKPKGYTHKQSDKLTSTKTNGISRLMIELKSQKQLIIFAHSKPDGASPAAVGPRRKVFLISGRANCKRFKNSFVL